MDRSIAPAAIAACATLLALSAPAWAPPAEASPFVTLSWDGVSNGSSPVLLKTYSGPGPYDVYVSLTGQSVPVQSYEIVLLVGADDPPGCSFGPPIPDAWRFESGGCAQGHVCFEGGNLAGSDPAVLAGRLYVSDLSYDATAGHDKLTYLEAEPLPLATPDPTHTYRLAHFRFEHTGTCAGEDQKVWILVLLAQWADALNNVSDWPLSPLPGISWNQPSVFGTCALAPTGPGLLAQWKPTRVVESAFPVCDQSVPTRATSWGLLKSTYR